MKMLIEWRVFLPTLAVLTALAIVASLLLGTPLFPTIAITVTAVLVNGLLATLEDDLPGGFNNPDGAFTPPYASRAASIGKWVLALILVAFGIAVLVTGLADGTNGNLPFVIGIALASCLFALALIARRAWLLFAALCSGFGGIALSILLR